ncbi:MFS transporter [Rhodococcus maanshanensis]|uniref:Sugar phosphate permease n=1 Tax=Rhodococcus maanshanensis TaxID=183556 RepID=A0A1H7LLM1_9NOCA|nr:Sugar phosphate permease [Rhodococcus maanshanensis]
MDTTSPARLGDLRTSTQRRTLIVVVTSQILGGAGLAAGVTVGALLTKEMLGSSRFAGLSSALFTLGSAAAALIVGRVSHRLGRRTGLSIGYLAGAAGGAGVVLAAVTDSLPLLFVSMFVYGSGTATNLQARYAGTDLAEASHRGRAVSTIMVATTFGAVAGPNLVEVMGDLAAGWGIPVLAGPFILSSAAFAAAGLFLLAFLRPDPLRVARQLQSEPVAPDEEAPLEPDRDMQRRGILVGATVMVVTQIVMVAIMTMTPIHMIDHGHGLGQTGMVIAIHVAAMFLPSPLTGMLADRYGRIPVVVAAGVTLLAAGILAALAPADSVVLLSVALALLGLGWNFGLISGTAILTDSTPLATRARTQGSVDLCIALAGAGGGIVSGMVVASSSFAVLSLGGGLIALALIPVLALNRGQARAKPEPMRTGTTS